MCKVAQYIDAKQKRRCVRGRLRSGSRDRMVCDGGAMLCLESLMARWRERSERAERAEREQRARSRSLCSSAGDGSLLQLLHRRASSAM